MPTFHMGPHPEMEAVLEHYDLYDTLPLTTFLDRLKRRDEGERWLHLVPDGVSVVAWFALYQAYLKDEEDNAHWKAQEIARRNRGEESD